MRKISPYLFFVMFVFAGIVWAHEGHEHAPNLPARIEWGLKGAKEVINVHPLFVHFPIALLLESLALYGLGCLLKKEELLASGKWVLYFGTLAAAVTVWTGLQAAKTVPHDATTHPIMMVHQYFGFAVLGLSLALSAWVFFSKSNLPAKGRPFFLIGLLLLAGILIQGADFGGRMVFLHGVGVGKKGVVKQDIEEHQHGASEGAHEHGDHAHH